MRVLLDTHALLWFVLADSRLSDSSQGVTGDPGNEVFISIVSLWEIAIKISLGKYALSDPFESFWQEQIHLNYFKHTQPFSSAYVSDNYFAVSSS